MIGLARHQITAFWAGKPWEHLTALFEPLCVSRVPEKGEPDKDFFKIFVDGYKGSLCVFTMNHKHVNSF
jgi:hypothetical protein